MIYTIYIYTVHTTYTYIYIAIERIPKEILEYVDGPMGLIEVLPGFQFYYRKVLTSKYNCDCVCLCVYMCMCVWREDQCQCVCDYMP